ncbi:sulfite:cytochrome C oxidoreductase subunit B [Methylobacterium radiodurans]|uniref:Sulfite:cytochrome C oxidoreductase subunit B n=1 Tax=Methylobacterium radiodurans TaxID=2202828 RepID=A0A2U8VM78_9HYPH|nr:sulfite:cytochrome C oxidoreductase subunit B [Methylobacterium radiodurans]AWN34677.1 sulfite:cytochrome C oxidoreductase subunit B [Methylobacterium radiodurans]
MPRRLSRSRACLAALVALSAGAALAAPRSYAVPEPTAELRPPADGAHAAGFAAAQANCMTCHSVDYIAMQPPGKGRAFWEAEVTKMIKVYRAPIDEADGRAIAAYLSAQY